MVKDKSRNVPSVRDKLLSMGKFKDVPIDMHAKVKSACKEKKAHYDEKMICWYVVIWRNKNVRSRKVGHIFGTAAGISERRRVVYNKKTHDFEIAEKYALIGKMKGKDFREHMNKVNV